MIFNKFVHAISYLFLIGAGLLCFFLILNGARSSGTLAKFYWFEANTNGFNNAPIITRWYNYRFCGVMGGNLVDCSKSVAAQAFSPRDNFGASSAMPSTFLNDRDAYYYLSRVGWAMLLIGLFFLILTIIPATVILFKTVTSMAIWLTVGTWTSLFFILLAACLYTGCYAKAKKGFHSQGRRGKMGPRNFAFIWTSVFLLLVDAIWASVTLGLHRRKKSRDSGTYGGGFHDNTSSSEGHMDKSTFNSEKPRSRTFFTKLRTKRELMHPHAHSPTRDQAVPADEVEYETREYAVQQPVQPVQPVANVNETMA
ncbi:hypothetical protein HG536_0D00710 [Torulaspora globosa]|uniref:SUR7 family protein FMP45 n=1 Tax=Torulaspora globosa TaxID=48254 RepID=A0A7G3ZGB3_9SACH|nr:uncharacterized protein HG536_0D00710 [Torulaspora globosa]QLL32549.1 hypothetical protein HG536_0D00710 [Torulaspora globosa]